MRRRFLAMVKKQGGNHESVNARPDLDIRCSASLAVLFVAGVTVLNRS